MATFQNPVNRRTVTENPVGGTRISRTTSGIPRGGLTPDTSDAQLLETVFDAVEGGFKLNRQIETDRATEEIREGIRDIAEDFTAKPGQIARLDELEARRNRLAEEGGSRGVQNQSPAVAGLTKDVRRLRRGINSGVLSRTQALLEANRLVRSTISEQPHLADEIQRAARAELGLFEPDLTVAQSLLDARSEEASAQAEAFNDQLERIVKMGNEHGIVYNDPTDPDEVLTRTGPLLSQINTAKLLERGLGIAKNNRDFAKMRTLSGENNVNVVAFNKFSEQLSFLRNNGLFQPGGNAQDKLQTLDIAKQNFRQSMISTYGDILSVSEINDRIQPTLDLFDQARSAIVGGDNLDALKNRFESQVWKTAFEAAYRQKGGSSIVTLGVLNRIGGPEAVALGAQQLPGGGMTGTVNAIVDAAVNPVLGKPPPSADQVQGNIDNKVYEFYFDRISSELENEGVSTEDARIATRNIINHLLPREGAFADDDALKQWHKALKVMRRPDFNSLLEHGILEEEDVARVQNKIATHINRRILPNLRTRLNKPLAAGIRVTGEGEDRPSRTNVGGGIVAPRFVDVVVPEFSADGTITLTMDRSRIPEEVRNDPEEMDRIDREFRDARDTYQSRLNDAFVSMYNVISGTNPGLDKRAFSRQLWEARFGVAEGGGE